jgi:cytoskeletal protein RodZ
MNNSTHHNEKLELKGLKNHREQLKLSVQAVADGMKVSKDFVHHIESGNFEKLGASTFVRGHITNYCKVLGIQPAVVLAQIPEHLLQHQQLKTSDAMGGSPLSRVRVQSNNLGRYAVGTALLGMLSMSFYFIWDKWSLPTGDLDNQNLIVSQDKAKGSGEKKITYSSLIPQVSGPNYKTNAAEDDAADNQVSPEAGSLDEASEEVSTTEDEAITTDTQQTRIPELSAGQETKGVDSNNAGVYSIVMQFDEQAWVSIKTLDGESIVQDLLGPGLREFQISEPVRFRIGNAQKLQLSINDNTVELAPLTDKDVADFQWPLEPNS